MKPENENAVISTPMEVIPERVGEVSPRALEQMTRAEIDLQISTAKQYPRPELVKIRQKMLSFATLDEETAESCFYTLKRQNVKAGEEKLIQGPSVRLAEIAVACYGNLRAAARVIDNDGRKVTAQGACHDLENNIMFSVEVQRRITTKSGQTFSEDMQIMTGNAANAIAFRNAVFKVIPLALIKPVYEQVRKVATGDQSTLAQKRDKVFKRFATMGVDRERVLAAVEKESTESVDLNDLAMLIGIGTAIKDQEVTIEEAFPLTREATGPPTTGQKGAREELKKRILAARATEEAPIPAPEPPSEDAKS